jgi:hypothetical protein
LVFENNSDPLILFIEQQLSSLYSRYFSCLGLSGAVYSTNSNHQYNPSSINIDNYFNFYFPAMVNLNTYYNNRVYKSNLTRALFFLHPKSLSALSSHEFSIVYDSTSDSE